MTPEEIIQKLEEIGWYEDDEEEGEE